jgi:hypothetical protein
MATKAVLTMVTSKFIRNRPSATLENMFSIEKLPWKLGFLTPLLWNTASILVGTATRARRAGHGYPARRLAL